MTQVWALADSLEWSSSRRRERHLLIGIAEIVAIDVDVEEPVVGKDLLQLRIGVHQRLPIPKPNVVDGPAVVLERLKGEILFRRKRFHRDLAKVIGFPREGDILPNVRRLQLQFVRLDEEALKQSGDEFSKQERAAEHQERRGDQEADRAQPHIGARDNGRNGGKAYEQPERGQLDMNVSVAGADNNAIVVVQQKITVQRVRPDFNRKIETEQRRAMGDCRGRKPASRAGESRLMSSCRKYIAPAISAASRRIHSSRFLTAT